MRVVRFICGLIAGMLIIPLAGVAQKQSAPSAGTQTQAEDDVREAVFRYQFKTLDFQVAFYFISIGSKSPNQNFLDRFRENQPIVRPASDAKFEKKPIPSYVDKRTEKQGVMIRQDAIHWVSDTQADVQGGVECGDLCNPASGVYHVTRISGEWNVSSFEPSKPR